MLIMFKASHWNIEGSSDTRLNSLSQWTLTDDPPASYINIYPGLSIYTKVVPPGDYFIDNNAAFYLFADAHGLEPT
eukprot:399257-Pleurochrysis_carterae.AAC.1